MSVYAIVGAGQAGAWLARTLRKQDADARIVLIGEEQAAPYERPPLSKEVLKGETPPASTTVLTQKVADEQGVELWLGETVTAIDRGSHVLNCASGTALPYDKLFLATGSRVRELPLPDVPDNRICYLRTLADAERLRGVLDRSQRVLVIGGGWIGLEVAAVVRGMDKQVSIVEMAPRLCARAAPPAVSEYLRTLHLDRGVEVHTDTQAQLAWDGSAIVATDADGTQLTTADAVVVAAGIVPNVELAAGCGLSVDNGIVVDAHGCSSDPDIYAAGDVTNHPCAHAGAHARLESWDNAQNQAMAVARAATGADEAYEEIPWFWSDQYGTNLQILGLPPMDVEPQRRGDPAGGSCMWFFWRDGRIASVIGVNTPRDIRVVKKWMRQNQFPDPKSVLDESQKLKKLPLA